MDIIQDLDPNLLTRIDHLKNEKKSVHQKRGQLEKHIAHKLLHYYNAYCKISNSKSFEVEFASYHLSFYLSGEVNLAYPSNFSQYYNINSFEDIERVRAKQTQMNNTFYQDVKVTIGKDLPTSYRTKKVGFLKTKTIKEARPKQTAQKLYISYLIGDNAYKIQKLTIADPLEELLAYLKPLIEEVKKKINDEVIDLENAIKEDQANLELTKIVSEL